MCRPVKILDGGRNVPHQTTNFWMRHDGCRVDIHAQFPVDVCKPRCAFRMDNCALTGGVTNAK